MPNLGRQKPPRPENDGSRLLSKEENQVLFKCLGPERVSLCAGIAQLRKFSNGLRFGVVVFVKDYGRREYVLKLYSLLLIEVWELVLHKDFAVKMDPTDSRSLVFHNNIEETHELKFFDAEEASQMKLHLDSFIKVQKGQLIDPFSMKPTKVDGQSIVDGASKKNTIDKQKQFKKSKVAPRQEIGDPYDFRHCGHLTADAYNQLISHFDLLSSIREDNGRKTIFDPKDQAGSIPPPLPDKSLKSLISIECVESVDPKVDEAYLLDVEEIEEVESDEPETDRGMDSDNKDEQTVDEEQETSADPKRDSMAGPKKLTTLGQIRDSKVKQASKGVISSLTERFGQSSTEKVIDEEKPPAPRPRNKIELFGEERAV